MAAFVPFMPCLTMKLALLAFTTISPVLLAYAFVKISFKKAVCRCTRFDPYRFGDGAADPMYRNQVSVVKVKLQ